MVVSRRKYRRMRRRRQVRRFVKRARRKSFVNRPRGSFTMAGPFPTSKKVIMRYFDHAVVTPPAGTVSYHSVRANSIFDPNQTGVGHQPLGHDQYAVMYNHYTVIASRIRVFIMPKVEQVEKYYGCGIVLSDDNVISTDFSTLSEQGLTKTDFGLQSVASMANTTRTLTHKFSAKKFFKKKAIVGDKEYGASFGANPSEEAYFNIWIGPPDESSELGEFYVNYLIEYLVVLTEPKEIGAS